MATPQMVRTPTAPVAPKTALCKLNRNGQFCNSTAQPGYSYCWKHVPGWTNKLSSLLKTIRRSQ